MGADGDSSESITIASNSGAEEVSINIRCSSGSKFLVKTALDSTVGAFKGLVAQSCDVSANQQRLIYKGRILKDEQTLDSYGLQADHTIHMVRGFAPSASSTPAGSAINNDTAPPARTPASTESGGLGGAGLRARLPPGFLIPMAGIGSNGGGLYGPGGPDFEQMQQQITQNPNVMRELMNMPAIQSLMNNPDIMRNLIMSNPQMREIIDRNPELAHILNDPGILRQTLETARNPELMREMMRNTDRAMSNIESSPEGFNMLRRMYENVQEPFMNATTMSGDAGNNLRSSPFAALLGNHGAIGGQHRDASNSPSTTESETATPNTNPLPNPWSSNVGSDQANNASRATPGDMRPSPLGGVGSLPDLDRLFSGAPDTSTMTQLMQNPAISRMMQSLLSNPQYGNQAMSDANPQLQELMQNPELLNQLASPEMMQQMLTLQQSILSSLNRSQSNLDSSQTAGAAGNASNTGLEMLMNMFGGLGGAGGSTVPENPNVPPEELYATQLTQLQEMGFFDTQENIRALQATRGNVNAAVERLLGNMGQ